MFLSSTRRLLPLEYRLDICQKNCNRSVRGDICQFATEVRKYIELHKILHCFLKNTMLRRKNLANIGRNKYQVC